MKTIARRRFLKTSILAAPLLISASVLGKDGTVAPSNRITLGFAGNGAMNRGHLHGATTYEDAQVVAVSDPDPLRRELGKQTVESRYAKRRESGQFKGCDVYSGFHEMLHRPDIDGIVMATGENWHGIGVILCARAGKHVYVEKPSSYTIDEALGSIEAVRRHGVTCQVGLQQRSWANFAHACEVVRSGALGRIKTAYIRGHSASGEIELPEDAPPRPIDWDTWLGPAPWRPFNKRLHDTGGTAPWRFCRDIGLGNLGADGSHAFDVIHWGLGCETAGPTEIIPLESGQAPNLTFKYPNDVVLHVIPDRLDPKVHEIPQGFNPVTSVQYFGALFVGENGWLHVGRQNYLKSYPTEIARNRPSRFGGHENHVRDWLDSIRLGKRPKCDIDIGAHSTMAAILGNIAIWLRRPLRWDPVKNEFPGDNEANRLRSRAFREPWGV